MRKRRKAVRLTRAQKELIDAALSASRQAHAPYSRFQVGAALRTKDGRIFTGCNVENASYGATVCAERNAVAAAVVAGAREFSELAIVTSTRPPAPPCGLCRQVLAEFCDDLPILLANNRGDVGRTRLAKLLPSPFAGEFL